MMAVMEYVLLSASDGPVWKGARLLSAARRKRNNA
jgi:hypothetical protein